MPYCPKCDLEFREGITECTECHGPLIASKEDAEPVFVPVAEDTEETSNTIVEFLKYSGIPDAYAEYDETVDCYRIMVQEKDYRQAVKLIAVYTVNERAKEEDMSEEEPEEIPEPTRAGVYVTKRDRLNELESSAVSFLIVGGLVVIADILWIAGILKLPFGGSSSILMKIVLGIMGILFLIIAAASYKRTGALKKDAKEEDELTADMVSWFLSNYEKGDLDAEITYEEGQDSSDPAVIQFARLDLIRSKLLEQYTLEDESYVDAMCDEIYKKVFEE